MPLLYHLRWLSGGEDKKPSTQTHTTQAAAAVIARAQFARDLERREDANRQPEAGEVGVEESATVSREVLVKQPLCFPGWGEEKREEETEKSHNDVKVPRIQVTCDIHGQAAGLWACVGDQLI